MALLTRFACNFSQVLLPALRLLAKFPGDVPPKPLLLAEHHILCFHLSPLFLLLIRRIFQRYAGNWNTFFVANYVLGKLSNTPRLCFPQNLCTNHKVCLKSQGRRNLGISRQEPWVVQRENHKGFLPVSKCVIDKLKHDEKNYLEVLGVLWDLGEKKGKYSKISKQILVRRKDRQGKRDYICLKIQPTAHNSTNWLSTWYVNWMLALLFWPAVRAILRSQRA